MKNYDMQLEARFGLKVNFLINNFLESGKRTITTQLLASKTLSLTCITRLLNVVKMSKFCHLPKPSRSLTGIPQIF